MNDFNNIQARLQEVDFHNRHAQDIPKYEQRVKFINVSNNELSNLKDFK